jgi:hypothetical protein
LKQTTVLPMRPPPADPFVPIGADRIVESSELVTVDDWVIDQAVDRWNHDEPALRGILEALANGRNGHAAH